MEKSLFEIERKDTGKTSFRFRKATQGLKAEAMMLQFDDCNILWDPGFACTAPFVMEALQRELNGAPLNYILLSHSHYDHVAGTPYIKEAFPEAKVVAAVHADEVFRKESARSTMLRLDDAYAVRSGFLPAPREPFSSLHADITVREGETIFLGSHPVRILETPGHTRDSICFWFENENFLLGTESLGVLRNGRLALVMLTGYVDTVSSLRKMLSLPIASYMLPHGEGVIYGTDKCKAFFESVLLLAEETKEKVLSVFQQGNWQEETVLDEAVRVLMKESEYYDSAMVKARELNMSIMVRTLYKEFAARRD